MRKSNRPEKPALELNVSTGRNQEAHACAFISCGKTVFPCCDCGYLTSMIRGLLFNRLESDLNVKQIQPQIS